MNNEGAVAVDQQQPEEQREEEGREEREHQQQQQQPVLYAGSQLHPDDPSRMSLSPTEREQALHIKRAIEDTMPELNNLNDYWYAQLAIIHGDNVTSATETAQKLQEIREGYDIPDTLESSLKAITRFVTMHSGCLISYSYKDGDFILVVDASKKPTAKELRHLQGGVEGFLQGAYSLLTLMNSDFRATRNGFLCLVECENEKMDTGLGDWDLIQQIWGLVATYPLTVGNVKHFHTNMFTNLLVSALKRFMPNSFRDKFQVGLKCEAGNLGNVFLQPSLEAANERLLNRFEDRLRTRYRHEATFRL